MAETCENWLGLVKSCIYHACQTHEIYQVCTALMNFKAPGELWNLWVKQYLVNIVLLWTKNL